MRRIRRKHLSTRQRERLFELHGGVCHFCELPIDRSRDAWDISHEIALDLGGADDNDNRKPAHRKCHRAHTANHDAPLIAKGRRIRLKASRTWAPTRPLPFGRNDPLKKKISGSVVDRITGERV